MEKKKVYMGKKGTKRNYPGMYRSKISNRKPVNRFSSENSSAEQVSTSAKKLKSSDDLEVGVTNDFSYRIVHLFNILDILSTLVKCKVCGRDIKFTEKSLRGLGFKIEVDCGQCEKVVIDSCPMIDNAYEINRRIVLSMRLLGVGLNGLMKFCAFMDLPRPIFQSFYDRIIDSISIATRAVSAVSQKKAAIEEQRISLENGVADGIIVSGDGLWQKCDFSSLFSITSLIGWYTKKVIDVIVKLKYCKACEYWEEKETSAEYLEWKSTHDNECQANPNGSSGKMEVDAAIEMFQRSEELNGIKYKYYIDDGDSKTFLGISNSNPYDDLKIQKKECIDHVQKRMGTRLREIVKNRKELADRGKLTGKLIDELSTYYGLAIRRNSDDAVKMRRAIWATVKHKMSTDSHPQHDDCPEGAESWCSWQRAAANGEISKYRHKPPLPEEVSKAILPIFKDLSKEDLLQRCLGGYTQNNNETFNKSVWAIAPKSGSGSKRIVDIATDIAVLTFNDGLRSLMKIMETLGITIGPNCFNFCVESDAARSELEDHLYGAGIAD